MSPRLGPAGKVAHFFIDSKLTPLIIIASMLLGLGAIYALPREEEPQIIVPMIDIFVSMLGIAKEVEERVTKPMEKLLWEIPGVEYIYSTSSPGRSLAIVRFYVGEDEEKSIIRLQSKLLANYDIIPPGVSQPLVKPRYIDDVPVLTLSFWSEDADHYTLRRVAAEIENIVKAEDNVSVTTLIGGYRRQVDVHLDPVRLAGFQLDQGQITNSLRAANQASDTGSFPSANQGQILVHMGGFLREVEDVGRVVVGAHGGKPVYLRDVASIVDGPQEPDQYVFLGTGPSAREKGIQVGSSGVFPAVTLSIAKRKGANAITARRVAAVEESRGFSFRKTFT
jgi:multidrug efflux pump subunit AcrB